MAIQQQHNAYIEIHELDDLILRPAEGRPNCSTRHLSQLVNIILKL